jgi:hypothetical protein
MMIKSKMTIANIAVAAVLMTGYLIYICSGSAPAADDIRGWAKLILIFIGISVAAQIISHSASQSIFAASVAAKEKDKDKKTIKRIIRSETAEDEMDEEITLRSSHIGYGVAGAGFVLMLFLIVFFDMSAMLILNTMLIVFFVSSLIDSAVSVGLRETGYRKGMCGRRDDE